MKHKNNELMLEENWELCTAISGLLAIISKVSTYSSCEKTFPKLFTFHRSCSIGMVKDVKDER